MSTPETFSLGRRLVGRVVLANLAVVAANVPYFLWRGYLNPRDSHETFGAWLAHELVSDILPVMLPLLFATLFFAVWTVRRDLAPIEALSRQAASLAPSNLDERLPRDGVPREILPLVDAFNTGLSRIADGFESQKRFTANAAHELRTPLAVLKARCGQVGDPLGRALAADVDRMAKVVDQLLAMARLETHQVPLDQRVDLEAVCGEVIAALYPLALAQGRDLCLTSAGPWCLAHGNASLMRDALRNLIENGLRLSPPGETVEVELAAGAIHVLDRGPGVADALKRDIFLPFRRDAGPGGGGAGLGLCIAKEIVEEHGGSIRVADRPGGGAVFIIDLSAAASG